MAEQLQYANLPVCQSVTGDVFLAVDYLLAYEATRLRAEAGQLDTSQDPARQETVQSINNKFMRADRPIPRRFGPREFILNDLVGWLAVADDEVVVDFLHWNERSLRHQQAVLRERTTHMQAFVLADTEVQVKKGVFPPQVMELMQKAVEDHTNVDIIDAYVAGSARAQALYDTHTHETQYCETEVDSELLYFDTYHEHVHGAAERGHAGFHDLFEDDGETGGASFFDEAMADLITEFALHDDKDEDTELTSNGLGSYSLQQQLFLSLLEDGEIEIGKVETIAAFFESCFTPDRPLRNHFKQQLDASFRNLFPELPLGLARTISREYNKARTNKEVRAVCRKWIEEIGRRSPQPFVTHDLTATERAISTADIQYVSVPE